jgi:hypothetical protein
MDSKSRLINALHGRETDRVPFAPFLAYFWESQSKEIRSRGKLTFLQDIGADALWRGAPGVVTANIPGLDIRKKTSGNDTSIIYETPVGTVSEIYRYLPDSNTEFLIKHMIERVEDFNILCWMEENSRIDSDNSRAKVHLQNDGREGLSLAIPIHSRLDRVNKSSFQALVEHYVGTENLIYLAYDYPEKIDEVLDIMKEKNEAAVRISASCNDYDYFLSFEDSSTQNYSPEMYEKYIQPEIARWAEILTEAGKHYVQHACGHIRGILPLIKSQGILAVESLSPSPTGNVSLAESRSIVGNDFAIIGGMEPTRLIELSEDEIPGYVRQVIGENGSGPFILANADSLPPQVSIAKLRKIAETVNDATVVST